MSPAQEPLKMVSENVQGNEINLVFNEVLFGIAMLAFVALVILESYNLTDVLITPYRKIRSLLTQRPFCLTTSY